MNDLVPNAPANAVIGICGDQGSGKTIFLTCIFQSIWTACADDVVLDFDRDEIGNADYFQDMEERVLANGQAPGTGAEMLRPARIYVKPYEPLPETLPPVLSVDIQDFAGRHFRSLANLKDLGAASTFDADAVKALREVNETLKKADAFVILINSRHIDPLNETPTSNPFSPSVNFMLSHCRSEKKPVALLFSQADQTRHMTEEMFREMPRVQAFERQFTSDLEEAARGKRPFGIVRRIACYETVEGDLAPIRQTYDGNIWRPEPAHVVLNLLRAAIPRINTRLKEEAAAAQKKKEEEELAARRRRTRRLVAGIAAIVAILLIASLSSYSQYAKREKRTLELLADVRARIDDGNLASVSPAMESALRQILSSYRADRTGTSSAMRSAISGTHAAFDAAAQRLLEKPSLEPAYAAELGRFRSLAPLFDPENTADWRQGFMPILEARSAFLSDWLADGHQGIARTRILDDAAQRFSVEDQIFASLLAAQSTQEKQPSAAFRSFAEFSDAA